MQKESKRGYKKRFKRDCNILALMKDTWPFGITYVQYICISYTAKRIPDNSRPERACRRNTTCLRRNFPGKLSQTIARNFSARARISAKSGGFFRYPLWIFPLPIEGCSTIGGEIFSSSHSPFFRQP